MRILLLGGTGTLGRKFREIFIERKVDFFSPSRKELDLTQGKNIRIFLRQQKFDLIVNCAGYSDTVSCEKNPKLARALNCDLVQELARSKIPLIHFSTDYVFAGKKEEQYFEDYSPAPVNFYGKSKAEGEQVLQKNGGEFHVIRTSTLLGSKNDLLNKIVQKYREKKEIFASIDCLVQPTFASSLAKGVYKYFIQKKQKSGFYHLTNCEAGISTFVLAREILTKLFGGNPQINKVSFLQSSRDLYRPQYPTLLNSKLPPLPDFIGEIDQFLKTVILK